MPNRIIREAILSSEAIASLTWAEEVFYRRLMSIVDDYGRFEANPQLIRAKCYPLQTDDVKATEVSAWLESCRRAGILQLYTANGKSYLEVSKFQQQTRTASKCPAPDSECSQMISNAHLDVVVSVVEVVSETVVEKATVRATPAPADGFDDFWAAYPVKKGKEAARKAWDKLKLDAPQVAHIIWRLKDQVNDFDWKRGYVPHPATYLNGKRWNDEIKRGMPVVTPAPSKTMQTMQLLQDMKNGLDRTGNSNGVSDAGFFEPGPSAGFGRIANDG